MSRTAGANALDLSTYSVIDVGAPLIAGALFAAVGADLTLLFVSGMYVLAALSFALLREGAAPGGASAAPRPRGAEPEQAEPGRADPARRRDLFRSAVAGIAYLVRNPTLRGPAVSYSVFQVTYRMLVLVVPVAVGDWLSDGAPSSRHTGALWAVMGLCGGLGAFVAGRFVRSGVECRFWGPPWWRPARFFRPEGSARSSSSAWAWPSTARWKARSTSVCSPCGSGVQIPAGTDPDWGAS